MADGFKNIDGVSYLGSKKIEMVVLDLETGKVLAASDQGSGAGELQCVSQVSGLCLMHFRFTNFSLWCTLTALGSLNFFFL